MSVNFYNNLGVMAGADVHMPSPAYAVGLTFNWHTATWWKRTGSVTSQTMPMHQDGMDFYLVPHVPLPPGFANPLAWAKLGEIMPASGSKAFMSVHSVTGEGDPLAVCLADSLGLNANCQDGGLSLPTGVVLQPNSVKTTPSLGDYLGAFAGLVVDNITGAATENLTEPAEKHFARRLPDFLKWLGIDNDIVNWAVDPPGQVKQLVQEIIDGA